MMHRIALVVASLVLVCESTTPSAAQTDDVGSGDDISGEEPNLPTSEPTPAPTPAQTETLPDGTVPFDSAPLCATVWNPTSPPAVADARILQTVAYLDSVGNISTTGVINSLNGTVPFDVYIRITMAYVFGALGPSPQTQAQEQCLGTLDNALGNTNELTPLFVSDMTAPADPTLHWTGNRTVQNYTLYSRMFAELRVCPCFNMIPRAIMEHLNCLPTPGAEQTLSSSYLVCQAVDMDAIYSDPRYFPTGGLTMLLQQMPQNRNDSNIENWEGGLVVGQAPFAVCGCDTNASQARLDAYDAAIDTYSLGYGSSLVPPTSTDPFDYLDAVAGTFITIPKPTPPPTHGGAPASMDDVFQATFTTQFGIDLEQLSEADKVQVQQVVATDLEGQLGPHAVVGVVLRRVMIATANRRERRVVWRAADTKAVAYLNASVSRGNLLRSLLNLRDNPSTVTLADGTVLTGESTIEDLFDESTTEAPATTEDPSLASGSSSDDDDNESIIIGLIIAIVVAIICGGILAWRAMGGTSESADQLVMPGPTPAIDSGNDSYLATDDMEVGGGAHYYPGAALSSEPELNAITSRVQGKPPAGATPQALPETPGLLTFGSPAGSVAVGGFQPTTSRLSEVEDFNE